MRAFVVNGSKIVRERLIQMLSSMKGVVMVGHAEEAARAIRSIQRLKPDVVVLDIWQAGKCRFDLLREIKSRRPGCTLIVLTNDASPQYRKTCMEAGADFFFDKSLGFEGVEEVFKQLQERSL